jgi:chemotaxis protein MotB
LLTVEQLQSALSEELGKGMLQIEQGPKRLIIRIEERGSFASGSADLNPAFAEMVAQVGQSLAQIPGEIAVEGHTDEIPISTARFRSNWDLSAGRAAAVANALLARQQVQAERLRVQGHADTRPRVANDSVANRALNRRVEIVVDLSGPVEALEQRVKELVGQGRADLVPQVGWRR